MELEHLFPPTGLFMALQVLLAGSLLIPAAMDRSDLYQAFVRKAAAGVVTFGPVGLLMFILYEVAKLA